MQLSNEVEIRKQELSLLAERLGQSSHSQLEQQLEETKRNLEEETKVVEDAKAAGKAAIERFEMNRGVCVLQLLLVVMLWFMGVVFVDMVGVRWWYGWWW